MWLGDSVIITNNVKETNPIRKSFREGMEQAVPTDAGEEILECRTIREEAEAGEILKSWDQRPLEWRSAILRAPNTSESYRHSKNTLWANAIAVERLKEGNDCPLVHRDGRSPL